MFFLTVVVCEVNTYHLWHIFFLSENTFLFVPRRVVFVKRRASWTPPASRVRCGMVRSASISTSRRRRRVGWVGWALETRGCGLYKL